MSHAIYKYPLPVKEKYSIELPQGAKIVRVEDVDGFNFLWAIVNVDPEHPKETRHLEFYKTGAAIKNPDELFYLGLCKIYVQQELGLYCFERISA